MRKVIKSLIAVLLIAIILLAIPACQQNTNAKVNTYIISNGNHRRFEINADTSGYKKFSWWVAYDSDDSEKQLESLTYEGKEYVLTYMTSSYYGPSPFPTDLYGGTSGEDKVLFFVRADTLELVGAQMYGSVSYEKEGEALEELEDPETETEALAREYAAKFVDMEKYTLVDFFVDRRNGRIRGYNYTFSQCIDGRESMDYIELQVSPKGQLISWYAPNPDAFKEKFTDEIAIFAKADISALIQNTIPENSTLYIEEIERVRYAITPDGQLVVHARVSYKDSANPEFSDVPYELVFALK